MQFLNYDGIPLQLLVLNSTISTLKRTYCAIYQQQLEGNPHHNSKTTYSLDLIFIVMYILFSIVITKMSCLWTFKGFRNRPALHVGFRHKKKYDSFYTRKNQACQPGFVSFCFKQIANARRLRTLHKVHSPHLRGQNRIKLRTKLWIIFKSRWNV